MKRALVALLFVPVVAHAYGTIIGYSPNKSGGINYVLEDNTGCNSGFGFMSVVPFRGYTRGCVTEFSKDHASFNVFFEDGDKESYKASEFEPIPKQKTSLTEINYVSHSWGHNISRGHSFESGSYNRVCYRITHRRSRGGLHPRCYIPIIYSN
jgi:hypothetical protein